MSGGRSDCTGRTKTLRRQPRGWRRVGRPSAWRWARVSRVTPAQTQRGEGTGTDSSAQPPTGRAWGPVRFGRPAPGPFGCCDKTAGGGDRYGLDRPASRWPGVGAGKPPCAWPRRMLRQVGRRRGPDRTRTAHPPAMISDLPHFVPPAKQAWPPTPSRPGALSTADARTGLRESPATFGTESCGKQLSGLCGGDLN